MGWRAIQLIKVFQVLLTNSKIVIIHVRPMTQYITNFYETYGSWGRAQGLSVREYLIDGNHYDDGGRKEYDQN